LRRPDHDDAVIVAGVPPQALAARSDFVAHEFVVKPNVSSPSLEMVPSRVAVAFHERFGVVVDISAAAVTGCDDERLGMLEPDPPAPDRRGGQDKGQRDKSSAWRQLVIPATEAVEAFSTDDDDGSSTLMSVPGPSEPLIDATSPAPTEPSGAIVNI
jgi:hypothetical protein